MNRIFLAKSAAGLVPLLCATFCPAHAAPVAARPADELVNSIGVNVKLGYDDTPYGNHATVKAKLQELGIRHIRDGLAGTAADAKTQGIEATIRDLNAQGVKFLAVISTNTSTVTGKTEAQAINDAIGRLSGAVEAVEGPNEPDNFGFSYGGQNFPQSIVPFQTMLWNAVKNGPNSALPVVAPSLGNPNNSSLVIDSAHCDFGNTHSYHGGLHPETSGADLNLQTYYLHRAGVQTPGKPVWATETGYTTNNTEDFSLWMPSMSQSAAGKYTARSYFHYFNKGVKRTYFHELVDSVSSWNAALQPNKDEANFGLYSSNWALKPAGDVTRNLIYILKDPGAAFTPGTLDYSLSGSTSNVQTSLFQKRDGKFYLVLWQAVPSISVAYNGNGQPIRGTDLSVPNAAVTLHLTTPIASAKFYRPFDQNTSGTNLTISGGAVALSVPDHPLIVELTPAGGVTGNTTTAPISTRSSPRATTRTLISTGTTVRR